MSKDREYVAIHEITKRDIYYYYKEQGEFYFKNMHDVSGMKSCHTSIEALFEANSPCTWCSSTWITDPKEINKFLYLVI